MGETMIAGRIIEAPSAEWIANRIADGGLVEVIEEEYASEAAIATSPETATLPRPRARRNRE